MPISFSDVTQLVSLGMAISALGIGVDGIMVPRLEALREEVLKLALQVTDDSSLANKIGEEQEVASGNGADLMSSLNGKLEKMKAIRDDLKTLQFRDELASIFFLNGSIVRVFLSATILFVVNLVFSLCSVSSNAPVVWFVTLWNNNLPTFVSFDLGVLATWATFYLVYLTFAIVIYMRKWHRQQRDLLEKRVVALTCIDTLLISSHLLTKYRST